MKEIWSRLTAAFGNLSGRERLLVSSVGTLAAVFLLYFAVVAPTLALGDRAAERLDAAEAEYQVVKRLRAEFDDVNHRLGEVEAGIAHGSRGSLRTTLENLAQKSLVNVESMEPQSTPANPRYRETKIEVGLKGVSLPQTVAYLHQIETADELLSIKSLRIRTRPDKPDLLDVTFTVSSFEPL